MNELLPKKEELKPIKKNTTTFYDCGFDADFDVLPFVQKLQIVNDIVRQTMLPMIDSNPEDELDTMIGNCHTAALISISYLQSLGIGKNYRYVLARKRAFDPEDLPSKHAILLVDDEMGNTYEYDATPFAGYGLGIVKPLKEDPLYEEYIPIKGEVLELINEVRKFMYERKNGLLTPEKLIHYEYILEMCALNPLLTGFASYGYKLLYDSPYKNDIYAQRAIQINPYVRFNPDKEKIQYRQRLLDKQIKLWQAEIKELGSSVKDIKRKQQLATWVIQESKRHNPSLERYLNYQGKNIPLSFLSPRFFYEEELNCIIIKPSAYQLGMRSTIRETFLKRGNGAIGEYFTNISTPIFESLVDGPADIFLTKEDAKSIYMKKKQLNDTLAQKIMFKEAIKHAEKPIYEKEVFTDLVHTIDNPSEAALYYLTSYPEHQPMTRFMYPNPRLERIRKK